MIMVPRLFAVVYFVQLYFLISFFFFVMVLPISRLKSGFCTC